MSLPAIPAELLHLCETEREAVRRYALQAVQSIDPARFAHGHKGDEFRARAVRRVAVTEVAP